MWILPLIGYAGAFVGFCFLTLAIASGLYYLSELVEEHTVIAKRLLSRLIYTIIGVQVLLWLVDGFPFWATMLGVVAHVVYLGNMRRFPFVKLSDPLFLLSCGMSPRLPSNIVHLFAEYKKLTDVAKKKQSWSFSITTFGSDTFPTAKPARTNDPRTTTKSTSRAFP